jgi:hypothetical protein
MPKITQKYRTAKLDELRPHPDNPRQGDVGAIHTSIEANGFYGSLIVQKSTQYVLAGNHRLVALRQAGAATVPVIEVDVDDATAKRILLADNRTNDLATYDDHHLLAILAALSDEDGLVGTGYDQDDLDALARLAAAGAAPLDPTAEWTGMPDYTQKNLNSVFSCVVHFRSDADADAFFEGIDRPKRKSFWWPTDDEHVGSTVHEQHVAE